MKKNIQVRAFAKVNLGLKVLGSRPDGYHEIRTVYQTVSLSDKMEVSISLRQGEISLECDQPALPSGPTNLVYRAAALWRRARGFKGGVKLRLEKRIPVGAGLGGGSSDAAITLLALERLTGNHLDSPALFELAAGLGSDVPLFLEGGRVLGCGRGEEVYPLADLPRRSCLIAFPGFEVLTAEAYKAVDLQLTSSDEKRRMNALGKRSPFPLEEWGPAENDFEAFVFARWPELAKVKRQLIRAGAETASLTGSGSALYAVFATAQQTDRAARFIPAEWQVFRVRTLFRAEYRRRIFVG
ncbi:MAG: 4-(cytidine 5'-diphospho)-2-C-methyl-D-erythritol kinase [Acidobacteria bacterium]|nr:4-(cytidine 5'-diphospho)-2-C-methyl-D-erythritol kinase [Acidobacteriota bacterium]